MKCFLFRLLMVFAVLGPLAAETTSPLVDGPQKVGMLAVPAGLTAVEVKHVIANALTKRSWTVKSSDETTVVGYLKHRGYEATLIFHYDEKQIEIVSDSFEIDGDGKRLGRANPTSWIDNLKKDIPRYLEGAIMAKQ